ncbi:MAG: biopolymer transporter ExbD [Proteobacteria bacterium]|jgi:biopolymer transport protein ExbD|nr:biopolymer transporter ExbD [Pseudomonadota bacterium]
MAGGANLNDDDVISEINVTPFVDVVLVLLVIFMVTAGFIVNKGLKIQLPQAATAEQLNLQRTFNILIGANGALFLDGKPITVEELKSTGEAAKVKGEKVVAMISADRGTVYSSVVGVMDALRQVGIAEFAFQLDALPAGSAPSSVPAVKTPAAGNQSQP